MAFLYECDLVEFLKNMKSNSLFDQESENNTFEKVQCERCSAPCEGYYTLSSLTKGLWVKCKKCGTHATTYQGGLNILWKPSKTFIKEVGKDKAFRIALELQQNGGKLKSVVAVSIPGATQKEVKKVITKITQAKPTPQSLIFCDAGTKNNGQKGRQQTIVVVCDKQGTILMEKWIGDYSNNEGEILGIIACLRDFSSNKPAEVRTDSKIAANWAVNGWTKYHEKQYRKGKLTSRHKKFIDLAHELYLKTGSTITWIPREENLAGHYIEEKHSI